ncbi:MAG: MmcQ/YjbR family DNA-binding protein [Deltaproteobacteria bacterium]|nr:MAG: MmcQ/YjbR family DNA-binding protein [Deltaproteobacteria bacterium]
MNAENLREYCQNKREVTEGFPFNDTALVFKVAGKMFALLNLDDPLGISLKCDPEKAIELREHHPCVFPAYHFNKKHWNTIYIDGSVNDDLIFQWIDHSYQKVVEKLPKKDRLRILGEV